jgi:hypothetical protein
MPAGAHRDVPAALACRLACLAVAGCVALATFAGAADGAGGVGLAHAVPYAAEGSTCRLFSAATDWRAPAAACRDGA